MIDLFFIFVILSFFKSIASVNTYCVTDSDLKEGPTQIKTTINGFEQKLEFSYFGGEMLRNMEKEIFDALTVYDVEKVEKIIEQQLIEYPNDINLLLRLAVTVLNVPLVDYPKSLNCLKHIFELNKNNVEATILECCINYYHLAGIDDKLVRKINDFHILDADINSIKMLILSWHFASKDRNQQIQMLRQVIALSPNNVFPYVQLGRILIDQGKINEGRWLIKRALENIKLVYDQNTIFDFSDFSEYLNQKVRGIHISNENKKIIERLLS